MIDLYVSQLPPRDVPIAIVPAPPTGTHNSLVPGLSSSEKTHHWLRQKAQPSSTYHCELDR